MRTRILGFAVLALIGLSIVQYPAASEQSYRRVVMLLWDTSQSMVMRKSGPTASENDLRRLKKYVSDLLFHGVSLPVPEPDYQKCQQAFQQNPKALIDAETLLIAHRFHVELEQTEGKYLPPSLADRERELWNYLPKPAVSKNAGYVHMETELVRPFIDALTLAENQGVIHPQLEEMYLVTVSDNLTETTIPPANLPKKYLDFFYSRLESELLNHRICTIGVQCNPQNESIHRILVNVYQLSKQSYLPSASETAPPPRPSATDTPAPTPVSQPTAIPTPAGTPTPWSVSLAIPTAGLGLMVQGNRVVSERFCVSVEGEPTLQVPAPAIQAELLDAQGNVVSKGVVVFEDSQNLPAKPYADFEPIQGDQWPSKARWILQTQSQVKAVSPTEAVTYKKESLGMAVWVILILILGAVFLFFVLRSMREPKDEEETLDESGESRSQFNQAKITLILEPSFGGVHTLEFFLSPGDAYQFGLPIQGQSWFEDVDCLPYKIAVEKRWMKAPKLILEEPAAFNWDESGEKSSPTRMEFPLSSLAESRLLELKGREDSRTWELQITAQWLSHTDE